MAMYEIQQVGFVADLAGNKAVKLKALARS